MPADTLTIPLTGQLADDVRAAAEARGLTPEEYVRQQLEFDIEADKAEAEYDDLSWEEDVRRMNEPGENIPAEEVFAEIRARLAARVTAPPSRK
jgi:hypothetical protein